MAIARERNRTPESRNYSRKRRHDDRLCRICGQMFKPRTTTSTFCSHECSKKGKRRPARVKTAARDCEICGTNFLPNHTNQRFCSQQCSGKAMLPRMADDERRCKVEGCEQFRVRTEPGYCSKHDYRFRFYGDPLAATSRQKRSAAAIDLDVDWDSVESTSYWKKDPSHCPSGHEYTNANTNWRSTRDGKKRRICKACTKNSSKRRASGELPNRNAVCVMCGVEWVASLFGTLPKFCEDCRIRRQRIKSRAVVAKKRKQKPKGPTYTCTACGTVSPTPVNGGMGPKLCDVCANQNILAQKRRLWTKKVLAKYSLTSERFAAMIEAQGNRCAVCETSEPGGGGRWHIDHDHACCGPGVSCGKCVRGLLCSKCNTAMGLLGDDPKMFERAINYQMNPPARNVP